MGWWSKVRDQVVKPIARALIPQYTVAEKAYDAIKSAKEHRRPGKLIEDVGSAIDNPLTVGLGRTVDRLQTSFEEPIKKLAYDNYARERAEASKIANAERRPSDLPANAIIDNTGKLLVADKVINNKGNSAVKKKKADKRVIKGTVSMANKGTRRGSFKKGLGL